MIKCRFVSREDFHAVQRIENECFKEPYSTEQLMYEFFDNPVNKIIVAVYEGRVVGFIDYLITFNSATIVQIAVTKEFRGKGIGTRLMAEMENSFPKNIDDIVESITLEVRITNENAINFYVKNGYHAVVIKSKYYKDGENALYMVKRLL